MTPDASPPQPKSLPEGRNAGWWTLLLTVATVIAFVLIRQVGEGITAPPAAGADQEPVSKAGHGGGLLPLLLAWISIIAVSRVLGAVFRKIHQPAVIGEVCAGLLLGPSLLGWLAPELSQALFAPGVTSHLGVVAQLGVLLFMFLVGLELDTEVLREKSRTTLAISHASIAVPFLLGSGLALWLYPRESHDNVSFTAFALFLGVSMSVTAFPVLARILMELNLKGSRIGTVSLTAAAVGDVTAWCLLAFVVGVAQSRLDVAARTVLLTLLYVAAMLLVARPFAARWASRWDGKEHLDQPALAAVFLMLLVSGLATEFIGIHTLFGAFFFGAIIPHQSKLARVLEERLHDVVVILFLPAFFAVSGLRTQIGLIEGNEWSVCGLITLVACLGKIGGATGAARLTGMSWRESAAVGALMNTRGLVELIVLNIGLDLGVISPRLFAMLVVMALVTTFATSPLLVAILRPTRQPEA